MLLIPEVSINKYKTISVASDLGCTNLGPLYTVANGHDRETVRDLKIHPRLYKGKCDYMYGHGPSSVV